MVPTAKCNNFVEDNLSQYAILKENKLSFVCSAEKSRNDILNLYFVQLKMEVPFCFMLSFA